MSDWKDEDLADSLPHGQNLPPPTSPLLDYVRYGEFKRMVDQISSHLDMHDAKSIAVLSLLPREGRSFFVSALALGYSTLLGRRVLVVNTVHQGGSRELRLERFSREIVPGGPPPLPGEAGRGPVIDVLSPATQEPRSLESHDFRIAKYIESVRGRYDLIISDTCAVSVTNKNNVDPIVTARQADTSILIASRDSLEREAFEQLKTKLGQWNVRIMGLIFNPGAVR